MNTLAIKSGAVLLFCMLNITALCYEVPLRPGLIFGDRPPESINFVVVKYDGCEYVGMRSFNGYWVFTHKGNCKNPIHIYRLESEDSGESGTKKIAPATALQPPPISLDEARRIVKEADEKLEKERRQAWESVLKKMTPEEKKALGY